MKKVSIIKILKSGKRRHFIWYYSLENQNVHNHLLHWKKCTRWNLLCNYIYSISGGMSSIESTSWRIPKMFPFSIRGLWCWKMGDWESKFYNIDTSLRVVGRHMSVIRSYKMKWSFGKLHIKTNWCSDGSGR